MKKKLDIIKIIIGLVSTLVLLILDHTIGDISLGETSVRLAILLPITILIFIFVNFDSFKKTIKNIKRKDFFNEVTLTLVASIAAFSILEFVEGLAVTTFFLLGEKFEEYAVNKSRDSIKEILNLRPEKVVLLAKDKEEIVEPFDVPVNSLILVKSGERVPIDGIVFKGKSTIDTSSMTGESVPRKIKEGDEIISGVINIGSPLIIKTTKEFGDSMMSKMLDLVENASSNKTKTEKFITRFAKIYTPIVIALAFIVAIFPPLFINYSSIETWSHFIRAGASFLVISCPCAIVLSVPMAYFVSLGEASKQKVSIKGSDYLDKFRKLDIVVFDKTGTITKGNFGVHEISPTSNHTKEELMTLIKYAEYYSLHPIAKAILEDDKDKLDKSLLKDYKEISGKGIEVIYKDKKLLVGNASLLENYKITFNKVHSAFTIIYCAYDDTYIGHITIRDELKDSVKEAINSLYKAKVTSTYMLTGDNENIAKEISKEANITHYEANLLPLEKVEKLKSIKEENKNKVVAFIGDGINDAPSLITSDLGISMGIKGSDLAIESSDAVIMDDDLNKVSKIIKISRKNHIIAMENIVFALSIKLIVMILSIIPNLGIENYIMWLAIFADVGVTIICVLNSLRLMFKKH